MSVRPFLAAGAFCLTSFCGLSPLHAATLDDFTVGPVSLTVTDRLGETVTQTGLDTDHVVGGRRILSIRPVEDTPDGVTAVIDPDAADGRFAFTADPNVFSYFTLQYGSDENPLNLDLTATADAFRLNNVRSSLTGAFGLYDIYINFRGTNYEADIPFVNSAEPYDLTIPFSAFGPDADLTQVDRIYVSGGRIPGGSTISFDSITLVPEPTSALLCVGLGGLALRRAQRKVRLAPAL